MGVRGFKKRLSPIRFGNCRIPFIQLPKKEELVRTRSQDNINYLWLTYTYSLIYIYICYYSHYSWGSEKTHQLPPDNGHLNSTSCKVSSAKMGSPSASKLSPAELTTDLVKNQQKCGWLWMRMRQAGDKNMINRYKIMLEDFSLHGMSHLWEQRSCIFTYDIPIDDLGHVVFQNGIWLNKLSKI